MTPAYDRELGEIRVEIEHLQKDVSEIKQTQKEMRDALIGAKGSWKVLTIIATLIIGVLTAAGAKIISLFTGT